VKIKIYIVLSALFLIYACSRKVEPVEWNAVDLARDSAPGVKLSYEQRLGRQEYLKYCSVCHGSEGKGDGFNAFSLLPKPANFADSSLISGAGDEELLKIIGNGGRGAGLSPLMPSWGGRLSGDQMRFVASYIRLFGKKK